MSQRPGDPAAQLADAVRQAKPVAALLGTNAQAVSAAVDGGLAQLSGDPIRVVRVRGLPGTPLTLSRIVEEIGADHHGGPRADDDELIVRVLATRARGEDQVVLLLEQAELLPPPTLAFLQVALTVFGTRTPRLQLVFAGHPKFLHLIDREELTPLRNRLGPVIRVQAPLAGPELGAALPRRVELDGAAKRPAAAGPSRRRWAFAAVPVLVLAAVAAALGTNWHGAARRPTQALIAPAPPAHDPPPPTAQALPGDAQPPPAPASPLQAAEPEAALALPSPEADAAAALPSAPPPSRESDAPAPPASPLPSREPDVAALPAAPQPSPPSLESEMGVPPAPPPPSREPEVAMPPPSPERRALPNSEQLARLRGEFDRFLSQTEWGSKKLSENERSRLFNEYLRWNYGTLAATPGTP